MTTVLHHVNSTYQSIMAHGDKRVESWPLMESPFPTISLCLFFAYCSKVLGPKLMKNREPFQLRGLMIVYNFSMVIVSCLLVYYFGISGWLTDYSYKCQPVDYSTSPNAMLMAKTAYAYYLVKFVEFLDTLFFILRKKYSQVSLLHVIHHGIMPSSVWWGIKFVPGGHATFFAFINSFIHIIMYAYYGLAAMGPKVQKYLWWKKYLTLLQLVQFVAIFSHSFQLLFRECAFPKVFMVWIGSHGVLFLFLFSDFYKQAYAKPVKNGHPAPASCTNGTNGKTLNNNGHYDIKESPKSLQNGHTKPVKNGHLD